MPEAANIKQIIIKPATYNVIFDDFNTETWTIKIDGHQYISARYSRSPSDIDYRFSTGEVWDMDLTVITGDQVEVRVVTNTGAVNTGNNFYFVSMTGTWLRT